MHHLKQPNVRSWANQSLNQRAPETAQRLREHKPYKRSGRWRERLALVVAMTAIVLTVTFEQNVHQALTANLQQNMTNWLNVVTLSAQNSQIADAQTNDQHG